ncbi:MAG: Abi family protein [Clostridiales bacterium]|nr:Abi family protein [Clostridiales bacterium]
MKDKKAKSINALMKHLRNKGLQIKGSTDKKDLLNIGYYHGYKGYRFFANSTQPMPYKKFSEVKSVYDFDVQLKALLYPKIMFIETALKNRVLAQIFSVHSDSDFVSIYNGCLTAYKSETGSKRKEKLKDRIKLRKLVYADIADKYEYNAIVQHFYNNNQLVPLWGVFELLTLGEFGEFYRALDNSIKTELCKSLNFNMAFNTNGVLLTKMIFVIKDLRNAIAHNSPIYDVRFKTGKVDLTLQTYLQNEFDLPKVIPVKFDCLTDYVLLVCYLLKHLGVTKTEIKKFVRAYSNIYGGIRERVTDAIYEKLVDINMKAKLKAV